MKLPALSWAPPTFWVTLAEGLLLQVPLWLMLRQGQLQEPHLQA